ncbi:MAG: hypothetical protein PSV16_04110 [Flavobacterium sp.]|nr:hypothetical protein [Flavobacterium sp.]
MKYFLIILFFCFTSSRNNESKNSENYYEEIADVVIKYQNYQTVEVEIPFDKKDILENQMKLEKSIFSSILEKRGFTIIESRFEKFNAKNNFYYHFIHLKKDTLDCFVTRKYEFTKRIDVYKVKESLSCLNYSQFIINKASR